MTTTDTMDTEATVDQSITMIKAGCEYVRITAPNARQAQNLQNIKDELIKKGYPAPIIADIHFTPNAAEIAAQIIEKVRINPGNYADKKKFKVREYSDKEYQLEIDRIYEKFSPLVKLCKKHGTAMRIGTNHGSLSDRIMNRYGDTPLGMVESALEFARICEMHKFHNLVFSMKASNPIVVIKAYRLLVQKMIDEKMNYPLHLGVTEAGDGEDGRIKSALGIGTLMYEGLGDTIRVSLTEPPENEIPVAKKLVERYSDYKINDVSNFKLNDSHFELRKSSAVLNIGGTNVSRVISDLSFKKDIKRNDLSSLGYKYLKKEDKWGISDFACDYIYIGNKKIDYKIPGTLSLIQDFVTWRKYKKEKHFPLLTLDELKNNQITSKLKFLNIDINDISSLPIDVINGDSSLVLLFSSEHRIDIYNQKRLFNKLIEFKCQAPVIISSIYNKELEDLKIQLYSTIDIGSLLIEGYGDGIFIVNKNPDNRKYINSTSFGILQASRRRISKTEYISCPSCGRTLFDLEDTTAMIRSKTDHLKGVKIGIMGCIVNGPGEMADADYGYVGTGVGKISLYRGQKMVKSSIDSKFATEALINLIKEDGVWVESKKEEVI
jgi:(E)-4-hydroxy-3-methylbut-2-enyl-diphosphate synthase